MNQVFRISLLLLFCFSLLSVQAQTKKKKSDLSEEETNALDDFGRKTGKWENRNRWDDLVSEIEYKADRKNGVTKYYYVSQTGESKVREESNYFDGKRDGEYKRYFMSGEPSLEGEYDMNKKTGKWIRYFPDGTVRSEAEFKKGVKDGNWKYYDRKGNLINTILYQDGVDVNAAAAAAEKAAAEKAELEKKKAAAAKKLPAKTPAAPTTTPPVKKTK